MEGSTIDIEARLASASDDEVVRLYAALRLLRDTARWTEIVSTFPTVDADVWPIDYEPVRLWRRATEALVEKERLSHEAIKSWYADRPHEFIEHWGTTYDPRNAVIQDRPVRMPMLLFRRQREFIDFLRACLDTGSHGLAEKVRDFGLTWLSVFFAVWLWATWEDGPAIGFGSRKEDLVDKIGDASSIFEKVRMAIRGLPSFLTPEGLSEADHLTFMKCINPQTGAAITGESGDSVGRGGRTLIYFKDESAHYARPDLIEAALSDNTNVQIDISTPKGLGNVFHRRREAGKVWLPGEPMEPGKAAVFIADWREHPAKDQLWYDTRRQQASDEGLLHVFKQEVDRDYAASVEGVIIPAEWVKSAIDAHIDLAHLGDWYGPWSLGLDVADGGGDTNALAGLKGSVIALAENWGDGDTGKTTRRAVDACDRLGGEADLQYDCIGIGAGVKAEANRLEEEGLMPPRLRLVPWNAGAAVQNPDEHVVPDDRDSPTNKAMFYNFKAQAWWNVRLRFERTHRARTEGIYYDPAELISIDSMLPLIRQIEKELSQPTAVYNSRRQLLVDKRPDGTKSPNIGDSIIMAANPAQPLSHVYAIAATEFSVDPFPIPDYWPRGFALMSEPETTWALWAAYEKMSDVLYFTTEHVGIRKSVAENAGAVKARGQWIPGTLESDETNVEARQHMLAVYGGQGLTNLMLADKSFDAGIAEMDERLKTGRLKVFSTCQEFMRAYRSYRRDEKGEIIGGGGIMNCARLLSRRMAIHRMTMKPKTEMRRVEIFGTPTPTGDATIGY